ncbi:MAG: nucleotidyltransferase family protein [bacterium]|nr:nucleotidyltransferase family protein [bacterium]
MTPENKQIMLLLKAHITGSGTVTLSEANLGEVIETADRQNILSMISDKLIEIFNGDKERAEDGRKLYLSMMRQIYSTSRKFERAMSMLALMHDNGIKAVALKGCALRDFYPVPEWRTMGDIDILISSEDMEKTRDLFEANGYTVTGTKKREFDCAKDKNISWEIKCTLEAEYKDSYIKWDKIYYDSAEPWKYNQYFPNYTLLLQHIIIHTACNLISIGAGVRNLCDIAVCVRSFPDIDYNVVRSVCAEEGYIKVYNALMSCVEYWFDIDISDKGAEKLNEDKIQAVTEYMLSETVYGKRNADNRLTNWTLREDDEISPWRKVFFPSLKLMKMPYPYLKKYPFLLPAAWVQRGFDAVVKQKIPIKQMITGVKKSVDYAREHEEYIKKLGLK